MLHFSLCCSVFGNGVLFVCFVPGNIAESFHVCLSYLPNFKKIKNVLPGIPANTKAYLSNLDDEN
jgi:hypothetical protein